MRTLRSMLLSMQRLLERTRHGLALGALTAALGLLGVATTGSLACGLYGPPSYDDSDTASQDSVLYGPPPAEVVHDAVPDVDSVEATPLYGIQPVDVVQDVEPPDVQKDCPPMAFYGPPPCSSDAECQADHGANWYCDTANTFPDGCGGTMTYPQCKEKG